MIPNHIAFIMDGNGRWTTQQGLPRPAVGWSMQPTLSQTLTTQALKMALVHRQPTAGLIHHSDRGSQYTSHDYQKLLRTYHICPSFGQTGSCFDNAAMESFFGLLQSEWLHHQRFESRSQAIRSIFITLKCFIIADVCIRPLVIAARLILKICLINVSTNSVSRQ